MVAQTLNYCPIVGGIPRGNGTGKNKQLAKEEAARQAFNALGWSTGASGPYHCAFIHSALSIREGDSDKDIDRLSGGCGVLFEMYRIAIMYRI